MKGKECMHSLKAWEVSSYLFRIQAVSVFVGKSLCKLVAWLREGGIDREAALLRILAKAPLPKKFVSQPLQRPVPGKPLVLPRAASAFTVRYVPSLVQVQTGAFQFVWHLL